MATETLRLDKNVLLSILHHRDDNTPPAGGRAKRGPGKSFWAVRLKDLRARLGCSQKEFADRYGISLRALQNWEQEERLMDPSTQTLIGLIEVDPQQVEIMVKKAKSKEKTFA